MQTCGCGLAQANDPNVVTQDDIDILRGFEKFLTGLLKEPVIDMEGKKAPFARYKYVLVDDDNSTAGYGWSFMYPFATVHRATWDAVQDAAMKGGCLYSHSHYMLPGQKGGLSSSGSNPYIWSDVGYFTGSEFFKDIPEKMFAELPDMYPRNYVGRPHELLVSTQQAIKCLQEKLAAQEAGTEVEEGRAAPAADYKISWLTRIPKWVWWAGGATLLLGAGTATALVVRGRKGRAVGAWEEDYDWDDDEEEYQSPWEEQVEAFQQRNPQAAGCPAEYDMADAMAKAWRTDQLNCKFAPELTKAITAAWEGRCFHARKFIRKARCNRGQPLRGPDALGPTEVSRLPVGSVVWASDGQAWVVNRGKVILPVALLPERASGMFPDNGAAPSSIGQEFRLVSKGKGKLPTHGTAHRHVMRWWRTT
jgi:hypothetical protein